MFKFAKHLPINDQPRIQIKIHRSKSYIIDDNKNYQNHKFPS